MIKVIPLFQVFLFASGMGITAFFFPIWSLSFQGSLWVGGGIIACGALIVAFAGLSFRRANTTVNPMKPETATALVMTGLYRYSRNPMYAAFLIVLIGWAVALIDLAAWLWLPGFTWVITKFQIKPEEHALERKFGAEYLAYKRRVRRWL